MSPIKSGGTQSMASSSRKNPVPKETNSGLYGLLDEPSLAGLLGETDATAAPAATQPAASVAASAMPPVAAPKQPATSTPAREEKAPARLPHPHVQMPQKRTDSPEKQPSESTRPVRPTPTEPPATAVPAEAHLERPKRSGQIARIVMTPRSGAKKSPAKEAEAPQAPASEASPEVKVPGSFPAVDAAFPAVPVMPEPPAPREALELVRSYIKKCRHAFEAGYFDDLERAAAQITAQAELQGWRVVEGMARYIARAATARDPQAVMDLMPDLESSVERVAAQVEPKISMGTSLGDNETV